MTNTVNDRLEHHDMVGQLSRFAMEHYVAAGDLLDRCPECAAKRYANDLMLELLEHAPSLSRHFGAIDYCTDLVIDAAGDVTAIRILGERTKSGAVVVIPVPPELSVRIERYLNVFRPNLRGSASDWLFPTIEGDPMPALRIGWAIRSALMERHG